MRGNGEKKGEEGRKGEGGRGEVKKGGGKKRRGRREVRDLKAFVSQNQAKSNSRISNSRNRIP